MNDNLYIADGFKIPSLNTEIEMREVKGRDGFIRGSKKVKGYNFVIPFIYANHENKDYFDINNELVEFFNRDEEVRFRLEDEVWYWNAVFSGTIELTQRTQGFVSFELNCIISDPFKYSNEVYNTVSENDHLTLLNNGTAHTYPVFRATALEDSTMFMMTKNDEEYFMIGESEDTEKLTKDLEPYKFNDEFNRRTFLGWQYMPLNSSLGNYLDKGDADGGKVEFNADSFHVLNWGGATSTNWHGAAVQKSIGESLQDFSMRFKIGVRQTKDGTAKSFTYLYDENNKLVFSIGYVNTSIYRNRGRVVVYAYDTYGEAKRIYNKYTSVKDRRLKELAVFMHLERKGQQIKITTYKFDEHGDPKRRKPRDKHIKTFRDSGDEYQKKVRIMNMYMGKSKNYSHFQRHFVYGIYIKKLISDDAVVPVTIKKGDEIVVDNKSNSVLINSEPVTHLKDFGADYFSVPKGLSEILFLPQHTFHVEAEWRDKFY